MTLCKIIQGHVILRNMMQGRVGSRKIFFYSTQRVEIKMRSREVRPIVSLYLVWGYLISLLAFIS